MSADLPPSVRTRRPFVLGAVAVVALLGGASAALAATSSGPSSPVTKAAATPGPSPSPSGGAGQGYRRFGIGGHRFGGAGFGPGPGLGGLGVGLGLGALHGQFVVAKPGGGYETVDIQRGKVTAVSGSSVTLRSADGFTGTYAIKSSTIVDAQRNGIGSVKAGNQASLLATVSGGSATAASIQDLTLLQRQRQAFGFPGQGAPATPGAQAG